MSYHGDFKDYMEDNSLDLLEAWLEDDANWNKFTSWLFDSKQDAVRGELFEKFINQCPASKEAVSFEEYCRDRYNARPEPEDA